MFFYLHRFHSAKLSVNLFFCFIFSETKQIVNTRLGLVSNFIIEDVGI